MAKPAVSNGLAEFIEVETAARVYLQEEMNEDAANLTLASIQKVDWSDSSLGCPESGVLYTQAIVPGFSLVFEKFGSQVEVHTDARGSRLVSCTS